MFKPGSSLAEVVDGVVHDLEVSEENDVHIIVGGTNDLSKRGVGHVEENISRLKEKQKNPRNIVRVEVTHRFDKPHLNSEISKLNVLIKNHCMQNGGHFQI
jgi:hypothetical protein